MLKPGTEGLGEILAHVVFDGAANFSIQLGAHSVFDEGFHDPVVSQDSGPDSVALGGELRALIRQILDIILVMHLLQHLDHAGLCYSQAFGDPADLDHVLSLFLEDSEHF